MALPSIADLKMWVGTLLTKDDWNYNFSQLVSWLADGTSDIVVNSIKSTNGIDMDGSQLSNLGAATSGSQAVTLDQANTLLNRTSYYYPFSVASGKVDAYGESAFLQKDSDTQVTVLAGNVNPDLVCIQSDGTIETVTSNTVLTVPASDGQYYIIKEKDSPITITSSASNKVTVGISTPDSPSVGDYHLNNGRVPFSGYKYGLNGWELTSFCWLGSVVVSGGTATPTEWNYNFNQFDVNTQSLSLALPDYAYKESRTNNTEYIASKDGWLIVTTFLASQTTEAAIQIGNKSGVYNLTFANNPSATGNGFATIPITKGLYYRSYVKNDYSFMTYYFVPLRGERGV